MDDGMTFGEFATTARKIYRPKLPDERRPLVDAKQTHLISLISTSLAHNLMTHDGSYCDFNGRLLATIRQHPVTREYAVSLQDADDMLYQFWTPYEHNAYALFARFFCFSFITRHTIDRFIDCCNQ